MGELLIIDNAFLAKHLLKITELYYSLFRTAFHYPVATCLMLYLNEDLVIDSIKYVCVCEGGGECV